MLVNLTLGVYFIKWAAFPTQVLFTGFVFGKMVIVEKAVYKMLINLTTDIYGKCGTLVCHCKHDNCGNDDEVCCITFLRTWNTVEHLNSVRCEGSISPTFYELFFWTSRFMFIFWVYGIEQGFHTRNLQGSNAARQLQRKLSFFINIKQFSDFFLFFAKCY